ncbi:MAG: peptidylprolyl isomerase [Pseudolabrys sp.]
MLRRLLKEPLVHFLALALVIFAVYGVINTSEAEKPDRIVITGPKIEQIAGLFAKAWQRPPTVAELKGLIDDYVKEEILVREALALRLDKDDTVIRRRLRLKMEFLSDAESEALSPTEAELGAYLRANPGKFEIDPMIAFRQIYLNPERRGGRLDQDAVSILEVLRSGARPDPSALGDSTLLPSELPTTSKSSIGEIFGREFAEALRNSTPGQWSGPIKSAFGFHIVRVSDYKTGRIPDLDEVRNAVAREWANERRKAREDARFSELLKRYQVVIQNAPGTTASR